MDLRSSLRFATFQKSQRWSPPRVSASSVSDDSIRFESRRRAGGSYLHVLGRETARFQHFLVIGLALFEERVELFGRRVLDKVVVTTGHRSKDAVVGDQAQRKHAHSRVSRDNGLVDRRHSNDVGSQLPDHSAFRSRLEAAAD